MIKKISALLLVLCFSLMSVSVASTGNYSKTNSFSSPLAMNSLKQTGDITSSMDIKVMANNVSENIDVVAYGRSTGCSTGCSVGCSTGCSMGCSTGCGGW